MKKLSFTLLLGWLMLLSTNLFAQNTEGRFDLKEGDWFEVEVMQKYGHEGNSNFYLRYQLEKQLTNNNQRYTVSLEHFKLIMNQGLDFSGYDSYYPEFDENKSSPEIKSQYILEVAPNGSIVVFEPFKSNDNSKITFTSIKPSDGTSVNYTYSLSKSDFIMNGIFSKILMFPDSISNRLRFFEVNRIPLILKQNDLEIHVINASFPLPTNAIIKGKLMDQINQQIIISLNGENPEYNFPEQQFKTNSDGTFNCPVFLKRPVHLKVKVGNKTLTTFMEPGDTLNITAIGHQAREIQYHQYTETKPNEYYLARSKKEDYFFGSAAYNTMLSNELDQYRNGFVYEKEVPAVIKNGKETAQAVNNLINRYRGKASNKCIEYFQMDFQYFLAVSKFYFKEDRELPIFNAQRKFISPKKVDYPDDFFMEVDTLPILMKPFVWNTFYQDFIKRSQIYKQQRLGRSVRKTATDNFMENYYFNMVSLKGYPLYQQIAYSIDQELRKGSDFNIVRPYYSNFLINCSDPALTEPLIKIYENSKRFEIGNSFPFNSFVLIDSTRFSLEKLKGKPVCIILLDKRIRAFDHLKVAIEKLKPDEVTFLLVKATDVKLIESISDTALLKLPNVTYIELPEKFLKSELMLDDTRIFMLDKWFRIVENNAEDPMTHIYKGSISKFEKSLRKTIDAKRYSKAEKTSMIKTAGWSFGSILFTLLVGFWIYKIRIRRIKKQEAAIRRIKELEIKAIRSQMNPHFIFNALNSIQSLINGNQFKEANIYLSKFAVLLRGVLNNSEKGRISLSDELQAVELYCQLEQLRFEFKFGISIDSDVNVDLIEIPGMIIQPLAENAVVHGLSGKGELGKLDIQVKRQNGNLCIGVSDNGIGLSSQIKDTLSQKGFGLKLVEERINILNLEGKEARLTVQNNNMSPGTIATLIIPID